MGTLVLFQWMSGLSLVVTIGVFGNGESGSLNAVLRLGWSCIVSLVGSIAGTCKGSIGPG